MILVLGGTREGRELAEELHKKGKETLLSVTTPLAASYAGKDIPVRVGKLTADELRMLCRKQNVTTIVDATHPFAKEISRIAKDIAKDLDIPYLCLKREEINYPEDVVFAHDFIEAAKLIPSEEKVFAAIGVRNLESFIAAGNFDIHKVYVRVLESSVLECVRLGVPLQNIFTGIGPFTYEQNATHFKKTGAKWLVTKASGPSGGENEKISAAKDLGMKIIVVKRPQFDEGSLFSKNEILEKISTLHL